MVPDRIKVDVSHAGQFEEFLRDFRFAFNSRSFEIASVKFSVLLDRLCGATEKWLNLRPFGIVEKWHFTIAPPTKVLLGHGLCHKTYQIK